MAKRFQIGKAVQVRFGADWLPGAVAIVTHDTVTVALSDGRQIHIHVSAIRRDLRAKGGLA
jgi:sRNA-binding protein